MTELTGGEFDDLDVARCYVHRPPYPPELYAFLLALAHGRERAVDLGCGPGKIARVLAKHFRSVQAIDPAGSMLAMGRQLDAGAHPNIEWIRATAEAAALRAPCDLVVAAASIAWMSHEILFPKLAGVLNLTGVVAVITGDDAVDPPWREGWRKLMQNWLTRMGEVYDPAFATRGRSYQAWMDIAGQRHFTFRHRQYVDDFIACQHSRATWTRARMGPESASVFDAEIRALVSPWTLDGMVEFDVSPSLVWGRPRPHPNFSAVTDV